MTSLVDKMKLPRDKDRRVRLTDEQKEEIREKHLSGETKRWLAREYEVDRRTIDYIVRPWEYGKMKDSFKERRLDGRYKVSKKERRDIMREHRAYKKKVLINK